MALTTTYLLIFPILSVWIGFAIAVILRPKKVEHTKLLLAFSGAFLLALTFFELLPEVYQVEEHKEMSLFILIGILLQIFLEFFSKGAEHGHVHSPSGRSAFPLMLLVSLSLHALVEGIPIHEDNSIIYGIIVHKLPVAIILGMFLLNSSLGIVSRLVFIAVFSIMTPFGTFLATNTELIANYGQPLLAISIGVFLHISTIILFESAQKHTFNLQKLLVIILGIVMAYFL
ncbi:MAG: ZIP family metal transporter [Bacteroidota bacterium]